MAGRSDRPGRAARPTPAVAAARPARNHRAGRSPFGFIPLFLASAAFYLVALYSDHTAFLPLFGALVAVNAVGYWISAARVIAAERRYRRRAHAARQLRGGAR